MTIGVQGNSHASGLIFDPKNNDKDVSQQSNQKWSPFGAWDDAKKLEAAAAMQSSQACAFQG